MSKLFLFTNSFPCNRALEHYIEHEMPFLAKNFEKIYILPASYGDIEIPVPENVEILNFYSKEFYKGGGLAFVLNTPLLFSLLVYEFFNTKLGKWYWLSKLKTSILLLNNAIESSKALHEILKSKDLEKEDCVFYSYWFYQSSIILSMAKRKGFVKGFISRGHQGEIYEEREPEKSLFKNTKLRYVDKLYLISEHARRYLTERYPNHVSKYKLAYLGVEDNGTNPSEKSVFTIVSCSKFAPHKRIHLIVEILKELEFEYEWYHLGYIPEEEQSKFVKSLSANTLKRVYFEGDYPNSKVLDFYRTKHVDLFLNTSSVEGLSVAVMEACSYGITLMATDINGTAEIVTGKSGYLLPLDFDPREAAKIVNQLYADSKFQKRSGARQLFLDTFDSSKNFSVFIKDMVR